jgi:hypothetical protein
MGVSCSSPAAKENGRDYSRSLTALACLQRTLSARPMGRASNAVFDSKTPVLEEQQPKLRKIDFYWVFTFFVRQCPPFGGRQWFSAADTTGQDILDLVFCGNREADFLFQNIAHARAGFMFQIIPG